MWNRTPHASHSVAISLWAKTRTRGLTCGRGSDPSRQGLFLPVAVLPMRAIVHATTVAQLDMPGEVY